MSIFTKLNSRVQQVVLAAVLLVTGILLCFNISPVTLSIISGALLTAYGVIAILFLVLKKRSIASKAGFFSCLIIAVGIMLIAEKILSVFVYMLPYVFIVVGTVLFADAFLGRYQRMEGNLVLFIVKLSIGVALIAFSICMLTINSMMNVIPVTFGATLIIASLMLLANLFVFQKKPAGNADTQ